MDVIEALRREFAGANTIVSTPPEALERLRALGLPEPLMRLYAVTNGGGTNSISFVRADQVTRGGGEVDNSVRGQLVFANNRRDHHLREIYCVDARNFFGCGAGAIVRSTAPMHWATTKLVASDAAAFLARVSAGTIRSTWIAKDARKALEKALKKNASHVRVRPGRVYDDRKTDDPDHCRYNFRNDGRTKLPWAVSHLYYVIDGLETGARVIAPFMDLEPTPDGWTDHARGFVFAREPGATYLVSSGSFSFSEGLVVRVQDEDPSSARILGHLLDVVTRWIAREEATDLSREDWVSTYG